MKNNLADLNDHLFSQLEKLTSDELSSEELDKALKQASMSCRISTEILKVAQTQIQAIRTAEACGLLNQDMPSLLATKDSKTAISQREKEKQKLLGGIK